ncbi:hypothetical protein [Actinomadura sp. 6N118]|uniref:hypothetical protein n=1 Tax=Actinomadura sp. 6N118 TaxID=3375151 RepID=UPI00379C27E7
MIAMRTVAVAAVMGMFSTVACTNASPPKVKASPDLRPVSDGPPYLCDLVSEPAFRRVTGLMHLTSRWAGPQTDNGLCLAHIPGREAPLGLDWSYNDGQKVLRLQKENWEDNSPHRLPADLGSGLAVIRPTAGADPRPNFVIALFRCGKERPWISIDFAPVVRGRDAVQDMVEFMRIAEKRFGQIHKCTPKPLE